MSIRTPIRLDPDIRPTVNVDEAAVALGVAKTTLYGAIHDGSLPFIRVRGRIRIPTAALRRMLQLDPPSAG
ncbi:MAG TPA: helix-turn-helix domain-containing protein [Acidimicrobiales bacterium]